MDSRERLSHKPNDAERKTHAALVALWHEGDLDGVIRVSPEVSRLGQWRRLRGVKFLVTREQEGFAIDSKGDDANVQKHYTRDRTTLVIVPSGNNSDKLAEEIQKLLREKDNLWSWKYFDLFHQLLKFSFYRPDLWRKYPPLVRLR